MKQVISYFMRKVKEDNIGAYAAQAAGLSDARREAAEALAALGYSASEAAQAVRKVENADEMDVEELLKAALKHLF